MIPLQIINYSVYLIYLNQTDAIRKSDIILIKLSLENIKLIIYRVTHKSSIQRLYYLSIQLTTMMDGGEEIDMATKLGFSILLIVFAIGVFLQSKIIKALKQDRTTAWEIQLSHSIVMLLHFSFVVIFEIAIYSIRSLDT